MVQPIDQLLETIRSAKRENAHERRAQESRSKCIAITALAILLLTLIPFPLLTGGAAQAGTVKWHEQFPYPTGNDLWDVSAVGKSLMWAVGLHGTIIKSTNGGLSWTAQESGTKTDLNSVAAIDANTVWAVGREGTLLKTTNGGLTWTNQSVGGTSPLSSVSAVDKNVAWACGGFEQPAAGLMYKTTDGGASWTNQNTGLYEWIFDVKAQATSGQGK